MSGPVRLPTVEIRLRLLRTLEAKAPELALRVVDPALDLPLAIRIADPTRQRRHAVVREHVAVQGVQARLVHVGREDALFQVVEDHDPRSAAQPTERFLVKLRPDLRARLPRQQPNTLATAAQREHEQSHPAVLLRVRVEHHRTVATVVDLPLFARRGLDHGMRLGHCRRLGAQLLHEATHALIALREPVVVDQVLPDRHRVAAPRHSLLDPLTVRLAGARRRIRPRPRRRFRVGDHRNGRF